ncbi:glycoside hydrolase family 16 protein [Galbibacter mesophilus]|uniref:glycoside hydrolase family 16 protein n=1 Tax=Galbibacter mesophilus TaxID=379069 RepID=UPI0019201744|nr:glycoside hydrolase family 16 protein [Galbibacter mesophilus]MCM5662296.1 glycoside hydrolase family 16 protein [Galbibacter mesophilus]
MKRIIFLSLTVIAVSCGTNESKKSQETKDVNSEYQLVWQDEFTEDGKPDSTKWDFERGFIRNKEKQYYTDRNVFVNDGNLVIRAQKDTIKNARFNSNGKIWQEKEEFASYSAGSVTTAGKVAWKYGRIEIKAKLPKGRGLWPAIWMLGENRKEVGWPETGEIDIMEHVGFNSDSIFGTVHTKAYNHMNGTEQGKSIFIEDPYDSYHVYAVEWTPEKIDFLLDGTVYNSFKNEYKTTAEWPFDQKFHLKINIAIGGMWGGRKGIDDSVFPQEMLVDYVRIYQKAEK